jgi:biopolymer transport protein ExbD
MLALLLARGVEERYVGILKEPLTSPITNNQQQITNNQQPMRLPDESETPFQINLVPMIDVIFSILAFFIVSTLYLTRSEGLPVNLPTASTAQTLRTAQINVTISANSAIALNRQPIALEELEEAVGSIVEQNPGSLVVIYADARVAHGRVVSVMDRLNQIKGVKLAIAAERQ